MVFTASLLGALHKKDSVENKPASLFVMSLGKALNFFTPARLSTDDFFQKLKKSVCSIIDL